MEINRTEIARELIKKFKLEIIGQEEMCFNSNINPTSYELCKIKSYEKYIISELTK